jgi:hypothetical protein
MKHFLTKQQVYANGMSDNEVTSVCTELPTQKLWCGTSKDGIVVIDTNGQITKKYTTNTTTGPQLGSNIIHHLYQDSQQRHWVSTAKELLLYEKEKTKVLKATSDIGKVHCIFEITPKQYVVTTMIAVYFVNENTNGQFDFKVFRLSDRPNLNNNGIVWKNPKTQKLYLATESSGTLLRFSTKSTNWTLDRKLVVNHHINAIVNYLDGDSLLLGTSGGMYILSASNLNGRYVKPNDNKPFGGIVAIYPITKSQYWIVSDIGIIRYDFLTKKYEKFGEGEGLASTEINYQACFQRSNGSILVGGSNGLNEIENQLKSNKFTVPPVFFSDFKLNETQNTTPSLDKSAVVVVEPQYSSFSFKITAIDFSLPYNYKIQYQLNGYDNQWITATNPAIVRYTNLPADSYVFQVRLLLDDGSSLPVQKQITFEIVPPFWKTWWFRTMIVAAIGGIVYVLSRNKILKERREAQLNQLRAEAETKALRAQMNPHFVFNCMNTIEYYIVSQQSDKASAFLQNFSLLIRNVLENSKEELITLAHDIDTLKLYIELERERADYQFDFAFETDNGLNLNQIQIPPLLLQPFVENAILHGLRHKTNGKGLLKIKLIAESYDLKVVIEDNGIGRVNAAEINKNQARRKQSLGMKVTAERIAALNSNKNEQSAGFEVKDLLPSGTRVVLTFPKLIDE